MTGRRKTREFAFLALFELEVGGHELEALLTRLIGQEKIDVEARAFFRELVRKAWRDRALLDRLIDFAAEGWRVERLGKVELSVLRLAACELSQPIQKQTLDTAVIVNEAVVLAKKYAGEENAKFINGILGRIAALDRPLEIAALQTPSAGPEPTPLKNAPARPGRRTIGQDPPPRPRPQAPQPVKLVAGQRAKPEKPPSDDER